VGLEDPTADPAGTEQKQRIRTMFDAVAPRYDFLNHFLSAGIDIVWRKKAVRAMELSPGDRMLDLCTGTGDLGFEAIRAVPGISVIGVDLARNMLQRGETKRDGLPVLFTQADAERLPLADASIHGAGVGFGIRNVSSLEVAFREVARVILPGGRFVILEFTTPPNPVFRRIYQAYFHHVLPRVGGWISGNADAYRYLPDSVSRFPSPKNLAVMLEDAGFARVTWSLLNGGIAALHVAER
jgi:demethylmenaquinone methyltransferase/2-methoxy-6-polyprenyl-1,4-benzoquinol methylase